MHAIHSFWGALGLTLLIAFGATIGILRAWAPLSSWAKRWSVRLGNFYVWALQKGSELYAALRKRK